MATFSMGFRYDEGKKVGYDISFPNNIGGHTLLTNVSAKDKARIVREIRDQGHSKDEIVVEKRNS